MDRIMNASEMLKSSLDDINALILQGVGNWSHALNAYSKIKAVADVLEKDAQAKKQREDEELARKRAEREKALKEAHEQGGEILGGETVRIHADGTQETLIP